MPRVESATLADLASIPISELEAAIERLESHHRSRITTIGDPEHDGPRMQVTEISTVECPVETIGCTDLCDPLTGSDNCGETFSCISGTCA